MKVAFVISSLLGGGAERVVSILANSLVNRGIDVSIITNTLIKPAYRLEKNVAMLPFFASESESKSRFRIIRQIRTVRQYSKRNPEAIIVGVMPIMYMVTYLATRFTHQIIVASDHTSFERPLKFHMRFIRDVLYKKANAVTMLTKADSDYVGSKYKNKWIMPNPLAYDCVSEVDSENRKKIILGVGRLDVWRVKGFDLLIEAWARIADKHDDWKLEIAGTGSDVSLNILKEKANECRIFDKVLFSGFHSNIDQLMRESSIFALTSRDEGFGLVLLEAMSQGCACVSFDCGGRQKEIVNSGLDGYIIEGRNVDALAQRLDTLIKNESDRIRIAKNGIVRAKVFNKNNITDKWVTMFHLINK